MVRLYALMVRQVAWLWVRLGAAAVVGFVVLDQLELWANEWSTPWALSALLVGVAHTVMVHWLSVLWSTPYSRRAMLGLVYAVRATELCVAALVAAGVYVGVSLLLDGQVHPPEHAEFWATFLERPPSEGSDWSGPFAWFALLQLLVFMAALVHAALAYPASILDIGIVGGRWERGLVAAVFLGISLLVPTLRAFLLTPFVAVLAASCSWSMIPRVGGSMGMLGDERARWRRVSQVMMLVQILTFYGTALSLRHSDQPSDVAEGLVLLGPWAGPTTSAELRRLIEDHGELRLGPRYLQKVGGGRPVASTALDLERVLAHARFEDEALVLFDTETFGPADLTLLLAYRDEHPHSMWTNFEAPERGLLRAAIPTEHVLAMLESSSDATVRHALLRLRFHRDAQAIPVIWHNLPRYDDPIAEQALLTLSVLNGRAVGWAEYGIYRATGEFDANLAEPDCAALWRQGRWQASPDVAALNICTRALLLRLDSDELSFADETWMNGRQGLWRARAAFEAQP